MKSTDYIKNIMNDEGSAYFSVYLPTMDKTLRIKHLSINDQKIISKMAIASNNAMSFAAESDLSKIAMAETNSLEPLDLQEIDLRDFFILCCSIRKENYLDEFTIDYTCQKCEGNFSNEIDFGKLIDKATNFEFVPVEKEIKTDTGTIKIIVGMPRYVDLIMMEIYYDNIAQTREISPSEKYIDYIICSISQLSVKDEDDNWAVIDDFLGMNYMERLGFIERVKPKIEELVKCFNETGVLSSEFFYNIKCPDCKSEMSTFMDTSDFFTL